MPCRILLVLAAACLSLRCEWKWYDQRLGESASAHAQAVNDMRGADGLLREFKKKTGRFPAGRLGEAQVRKDEWELFVGLVPLEAVRAEIESTTGRALVSRDYWGRPYMYSTDGSRCQIVYLGKNGNLDRSTWDSRVGDDDVMFDGVFRQVAPPGHFER